MAKRRKIKFSSSKKHLARLEKERRQRTALIIGTAAVLIIVFGLIFSGVVNHIITQRQPVAIIDEEEISTNEFQKRVKYERYQLVRRYLSLYQNMLSFGAGEDFLTFFEDELSKIQNQLDSPFFGQGILNRMIEDILIQQEVIARDIQVSEEEIDEAIKEAFGFTPTGILPTFTPRPTSPPTSTLSATQYALVSPTPTQTQTSTPEVTPTATTTSSPSPTQADVETATTTATPLVEPTADPLVRFEEDFAFFMDDLQAATKVDEEEFRSYFANFLFREKVFELITIDVERYTDQVWARHILVETEEEAQAAHERIMAGEDWTELASELSTDEGTKDTGGDMGWFPMGRMVAEFEEVAFSLGIGEISEPFNSVFGWHIIQVLGHEERMLDPNEYEQLRQIVFMEWLNELRDNATIEIAEDLNELTPIEPDLPDHLRLTP